MIAKYPVICFALLLFFSACTTKKPVVSTSKILQNSTSFWNYKQQYVQLYEDYNAVDDQLKPLTRESFLQQLSTGRYLPLRLQSEDTIALYQLYPLPAKVDHDLKALLKQWALTEYDYYQAEGKPLPAYRFVDMNGKEYSAETTTGKILVLKCWFVHCVACVAEMPALNDLVQHYKNRDDIVFVSLCLDSKDKVATFLKKNRFDYATIPNQTNYLEDKLKIMSYPMHYVVNKQGLITKKVNSHKGAVYTLNKIQ